MSNTFFAKAPGEDCDCVVQDTGEHKKLSELKRGMYIVVRTPRKCLPTGTVRSDAIEVMVTNYEVVFGKHPSGVFYQPVKYMGGRWVPISFDEVVGLADLALRRSWHPHHQPPPTC